MSFNCHLNIAHFKYSMDISQFCMQWIWNIYAIKYNNDGHIYIDADIYCMHVNLEG